MLKNGCICCTRDSKGDELERTLDVLLKLVEDTPDAFNYVVIECSGASGAACVAFQRDRDVESRPSGILHLVENLIGFQWTVI